MVSAKPRTLGEIKADAVYPREEFFNRTGLTWASFRSARARGLRVCKVGKRVWVRGSDFIEFIAQTANSGAKSDSEAVFLK